MRFTGFLVCCWRFVCLLLAFLAACGLCCICCGCCCVVLVLWLSVLACAGCWSVVRVIYRLASFRGSGGVWRRLSVWRGFWSVVLALVLCLFCCWSASVADCGRLWRPVLRFGWSGCASGQFWRVFGCFAASGSF